MCVGVRHQWNSRNVVYKQENNFLEVLQFFLTFVFSSMMISSEFKTERFPNSYSYYVLLHLFCSFFCTLFPAVCPSFSILLMLHLCRYLHVSVWIKSRVDRYPLYCLLSPGYKQVRISWNTIRNGRYFILLATAMTSGSRFDVIMKEEDGVILLWHRVQIVTSHFPRLRWWFNNASKGRRVVEWWSDGRGPRFKTSQTRGTFFLKPISGVSWKWSQGRTTYSTIARIC